MNWKICGAGHSYDPDRQPEHDRCADPGRRHPCVSLENAITSPVRYTRTCYATAEDAFAALAGEQPYNNTRAVASWCFQAHCPHGCRTGTAMDRPVTQDPLPGQVGVFRCPACKSEYVPGEWPSCGAEWMARTLAGYGLKTAALRLLPGPDGGGLAAVDAYIPAGLNADVAGYRIRIHEDTTAARPGAGPGRPVEFREPVVLFLTPPGGALPAHAHNGLSVPRALELIRGYAGLRPDGAAGPLRL